MLTNANFHVIITRSTQVTENNGGIAQWLEHPVHTRQVIGSNPISATRPVGQAVKTRPFHGCNMGSIPVRVTTPEKSTLKKSAFFIFGRGDPYGLERTRRAQDRCGKTVLLCYACAWVRKARRRHDLRLREVCKERLAARRADTRTVTLAPPKRCFFHFRA